MLVAGSYNRTVWNHETLAPYVEVISTPADARGPVNWAAAPRGDVGHHANRAHHGADAHRLGNEGPVPEPEHDRAAGPAGNDGVR